MTKTPFVRRLLGPGAVLFVILFGLGTRLVFLQVFLHDRYRKIADSNTNLGIVLLFAPLVRAAATRRQDETVRSATQRTLAQLDVNDCAAAFGAIAKASPGGLGEAPEHDVRAPANVSLRQAMASAAYRDSIASEYATDYAIVFETEGEVGRKKLGLRDRVFVNVDRFVISA